MEFQYFWQKEAATRRMKIAFGAWLFCGIGAATAGAEERRNEAGFLTGPPLGCYARVWTDADLAGSPKQVIKAMRAKAHTYEGGPIQSDHYMTVDVILAEQGIARSQGLGGARIVSQLSCHWFQRVVTHCFQVSLAWSITDI